VKQEVGVGKCGWAAGVYLCLFINNLLGLRVDVPAGKAWLRPFCPRPEFTWTDCRLGTARFDFFYQRRDTGMFGRIVNRNETSFEAGVELLLPVGVQIAACKRDGVPTQNAM